MEKQTSGQSRQGSKDDQGGSELFAAVEEDEALEDLHHAPEDEEEA